METSSSCKAVIIEGTDKCGKTTLAAELSAKLGWPVVKASQPKGDPIAEYYLTASENPRFIADRYHLGESVYGPMYRNTLPIGYASFRAFEEKIEATHHPLLVLLEDDADRIEKRFREFREDFAQRRHISLLLSEFRREWATSTFAKIRAVWHPELAACIARIVAAQL